MKAKAASRPVRHCGSTTRQKVCGGLAPRSRAASSVVVRDVAQRGVDRQDREGQQEVHQRHDDGAAVVDEPGRRLVDDADGRSAPG